MKGTASSPSGPPASRTSQAWHVLMQREGQENQSTRKQSPHVQKVAELLRPPGGEPLGLGAVTETQEPEEAPPAHTALCGPHGFSADYSPSPHHSIPSFKGVCLCEDSGKTRNGSNQSWASGKLGYIYRKSWPQSLHPRLIEPRVIFSKENEILRKSFKIICWKRREKINWGEQPCLIHPYISYSLNFFLKAFHLGLPSV